MTRRPTELPSKLLQLVNELAERLDAHHLRLEALERTRGPRDQHERGVLEALAELVRDDFFTPKDVIERCRLDPHFEELLAAADVVDSKAAAYLLRDSRGHSFDGRRLAYDDQARTWRFGPT